MTLSNDYDDGLNYAHVLWTEIIDLNSGFGFWSIVGPQGYHFPGGQGSGCEQDNNGSGTGFVTVTFNCDLPTGEQFQYPPLSHWNFGAVNGHASIGYDFTEMLVGGSGTFAGRQVQEFDAAPSIDTCSTPSSAYQLGPTLTGSTWTIDSNNLFTDTVGVRSDVISYFQATLLPGFSCSGVFFQQMKMYCSSTGQWESYGQVNRLEIRITPNTVSLSRAGVGATRRWP
jgi:hypothetical protein